MQRRFGHVSGGAHEEVAQTVDLLLVLIQLSEQLLLLRVHLVQFRKPVEPEVLVRVS